MAVRFMFRKFSSRISGSRCLLSAHESASAIDAAPVTRRASEGGIGAVSNNLHGASAQPATATAVFNDHAINGYAARYVNSFPCPCHAAKTVSPTTDVPSLITHHAKPAFVGPVRGVKKSFSSSSSIKNSVNCETESAARGTEMKAKSISEAIEAERKAYDDAYKKWAARMDKRNADFNRFVNTIMLTWTFVVIYCVFKSRSAAPRVGEVEKS